MTELLDAIFNCDLKKIKTILPNGRNVNLKIPGTEGCTALHLVAGIENIANGKKEILSYLLEIGADPNARSFDDLTPVHLAAMWNNCCELEKLLQNGGNPWLTDNENKNSFDLAMDNHAYEAYQLLHRYLSEDKLNFRNYLPKICFQPDYWGKKNNDNKSNDNYESEFTDFCTANENFPLYLSSTDDDCSDFFLNVSKILKKNPIKTQSPKQQQPDNKNFKNKSLIKTLKKKKEIELPYDSDTTNYSIDIKITKRKICKTPAISFSDSTEICSTSENEYVVPEKDSTETIIESNNNSGIILVEKCTAPSRSFSYRKNECSQDLMADWKSFHTQDNSYSSSFMCEPHNNSDVTIPDEYKLLNNTQIFQALKALGDDPGPIFDATREIYLRRLTRLKKGCSTSCILPAAKYCPEIYLFLEGKLDADKTQNLINILTEEFTDFDTAGRNGNGNQRCSFNYFLLDPRVTQNLPTRLKQLSFGKVFLLFLDSLFYVGKGTKNRPYQHLIEAANASNNTEEKSAKIDHILDIWNAGLGVVSLHCFNNSIAAEAYTQEACIIEAIGLQNLTNIKSGNYFGKASKWKKSWKRQVGVSLLHRALQIFILEGEKQIMPKDVRRKK